MKSALHVFFLPLSLSFQTIRLFYLAIRFSPRFICSFSATNRWVLSLFAAMVPDSDIVMSTPPRAAKLFKAPTTPVQSWWGQVYGPGVEGCGNSGFPPSPEFSPVCTVMDDGGSDCEDMIVADSRLKFRSCFMWKDLIAALCQWPVHNSCKEPDAASDTYGSLLASQLAIKFQACPITS